MLSFLLSIYAACEKLANLSQQNNNTNDSISTATNDRNIVATTDNDFEDLENNLKIGEFLTETRRKISLLISNQKREPNVYLMCLEYVC